MKNARIVLELPCGCKAELYRGDVVGIPFGKLPNAVADVVMSMERRGCHCPSIAHTA